MQICDSEDVRIMSGVVSRDHIHMHIEYPPKLALSDLVKIRRAFGKRLMKISKIQNFLKNRISATSCKL
jgi:putative transposase